MTALNWTFDHTENGKERGLALAVGLTTAYANVVPSFAKGYYNAWYEDANGNRYSHECTSLLEGVAWCEEQHALRGGQ